MNPRRKAGCALAVLAVAAALVAGALRVPPPVPALTAGVEEADLPNGLRVITRPAHAAPVVYVGVWYDVGTRTESPGTHGISHLLEHLTFKGTRTYGPGVIPRLLAANGATFNGSTGIDATEYYEVLPADRLDLALRIEADRMVHARLDPDDIAREKKVVRTEAEGRRNDPRTRLGDAVIQAAFRSHPYHWHGAGDLGAVSLDRAALARYYRDHYRPDRAAVVLVGDFDRRAALDEVRRYFGPIPRGTAPDETYPPEPPQTAERRVTLTGAGKLPIVTVAYRAPAAGSPDGPALDALVEVLRGGTTGRLDQLRAREIGALTVSASYQPHRDPYLSAPGWTRGRRIRLRAHCGSRTSRPWRRRSTFPSPARTGRRPRCSGAAGAASGRPIRTRPPRRC